MNGLFDALGKIFDTNSDGEVDCGEAWIAYNIFEEVTKDDDDDDDDDDNDDDDDF